MFADAIVGVDPTWLDFLSRPVSLHVFFPFFILVEDRRKRVARMGMGMGVRFLFTEHAR